MPREAEPSSNERAFILEALQQNVRVDDRALDAYRPIQVHFGDEYGVADVRLGETRVLTCISATVTAPSPDRKFDGVFTITTELSPLASPAFEVGRQTELETNLSRNLETTFRRSNALSTESLCLVAGQKVWHLRADIHILDAHGNLLDAAALSLLASLRHYRIPSTEIRGGELTVFSVVERDPVPLALLHNPLCVSLSFYEAGEKALVDAELKEQQCAEGEVVVGANAQGEVCLISKMGGVEVEAVTLLRCVGVALAKARELVELVDRALEMDAKFKERGGLIAELSAENDR